jgi:hypothetical protein
MTVNSVSMPISDGIGPPIAFSSNELSKVDEVAELEFNTHDLQ